MKKLKVMHIIWNMNDGGAQKVILNYLEDFESDPDISLEVFVFKEKVDSICNKIIDKKGYKVHYLNNPQFKIQIPYIKRYFNKRIAQRKWRDVIREYCPDIVHVHISDYLCTTLQPIADNNVALRFDTLHSNPYRYKGLTLRTIRNAFQKEHFIPICVTAEQSKSAARYYGFNDFEVLHNGIDFKKLVSQSVEKEKARDTLGLKKDSFVVLGVGRLHRIKKFDFLIYIYAELLNINSNAELIIAGDGEEFNELSRIINNLGIEKKVHLIGNRDDMPLIYSAADVLAVTSESESSSIVLLEAQALGLRCVISSGVPTESIYTNRVEKMSQNATLKQWASALNNIDFVGKAYSKPEDYDVHAISLKLKEIYLRRWNEYVSKKQ